MNLTKEAETCFAKVLGEMLEFSKLASLVLDSQFGPEVVQQAEKTVDQLVQNGRHPSDSQSRKSSALRLWVDKRAAMQTLSRESNAVKQASEKVRNVPLGTPLGVPAGEKAASDKPESERMWESYYPTPSVR